MYRSIGLLFGETQLAISKDLIAASATPIVLSILSEGENYGYAIIKRVRDLSGDQIQWTDGMLYPVLHRLEERKMITAKWELSEGGRQRKYYRLTAKGHKALAANTQQWQMLAAVMGKVLGSSAKPLSSRQLKGALI